MANFITEVHPTGNRLLIRVSIIAAIGACSSDMTGVISGALL